MKVNYVVMYMLFYGIGRHKLCHKYFEKYEDIKLFIEKHNKYEYPRIFEYSIFKFESFEKVKL